MADKFATVDDYISSFPQDVQIVLEEVRRTIHSAVPGAAETISYQIPTITLDGKYLVYAPVFTGTSVRFRRRPRGCPMCRQEWPRAGQGHQ
jgi:hypothetical protein